jgi:pyridoxine/pyridoxamine 5'-phosphate oxidase
MAVTRDDLLAFIGRRALAVQASVSSVGAPQAAVVGFVIDDRFHVFFDTVASSRKCANLRREPRIALVIGWEMDEGCTVQLEGTADEPRGEELDRLKRVYFDRFPDGVARQSWPGITYFRVRPTWIRFSDFRGAAPTIVEFAGDDLT